MSDTMIAVSRKAYQAYVNKDRAAIEAVIDDDFHFSSPLDNRLNRKTYFDWCWKNSEWITGFNFINLVPDGERVFVIYEGQSTTGKRFRNTEILTMRNGKIVEVEVYFGCTFVHIGPHAFVIQADRRGSAPGFLGFNLYDSSTRPAPPPLMNRVSLCFH